MDGSTEQSVYYLQNLTLNGTNTLTGALIADRLVVNGSAVLQDPDL